MKRPHLNRLLARVGALTVAAATGIVGAAAPALAQGDEIGGTGNEYFLNDSLSASANIHFFYGAENDRVYVGDWNGDDVDSLGVRRGNIYHFRNALSGGPADVLVAYGRSEDVVLSGDWDGDGDDTLAVRRGNLYHLRNSLSSGPADQVVAYGTSTDTVLVGDWDGDGDDTLAVRRGNLYYIRNSLSSGPADVVVAYGRTGDVVLVGDWDGDGDDSLAVRRANLYFLKNTLGPGDADTEVAYGRATDAVFSGDWNADSRDTLGVRRVFCPPFGSTADQSSGPNPFEDLSTITGSSMRTGTHPCFDRVVFEFRGDGPLPGWTAEYVDVIRNEDTGEPVQPPFAGNAFIEVAFGAWHTGEPVGAPPFSGPSRILPSGFPALREARVLGGFESISELGIGLDRERPFRVVWLENPVRLVVDVYTG